MLATSLNPQTRHFNLAETRHLNLGLTSIVEALLRCPGLDFLEMSGFEVQKYLLSRAFKHRANPLSGSSQNRLIQLFTRQFPLLAGAHLALLRSRRFALIGP